MFGIHYFKVAPSEYVFVYKKGKIKRQGTGLSFFYFGPTTSLVIVPSASSDAPFLFQDTTSDFQEIDIQGQISYRVLEPQKLSSLLDFTIDRRGKYLGDGAEKLTVRLTNLVQITLREKLQSMDLRTAITSIAEVVEFAKDKIINSSTASSLGLEIIEFSILKISPTPEISRALEASAREILLQKADEAVYERRNFAVEQERRIQENELLTKISIEEKNRKIREEVMNAEIAVQKKKGEIEDIKMSKMIDLEKQKKALVEYQSENIIKNAKAKSEALRMEMEAISVISPQLLEIMSEGQMDSRKLISKAIRELAKNSEKIGTLNFTPDLLNSLLEEKSK